MNAIMQLIVCIWLLRCTGSLSILLSLHATTCTFTIFNSFNVTYMCSREARFHVGIAFFPDSDAARDIIDAAILLPL